MKITTCACGQPMFIGDAVPQQPEPEAGGHASFDLFMSLLVAAFGPDAPQQSAPKATADTTPGGPTGGRESERGGCVRTVDVFVIDLS
ncbi:hypothetical protein ACPC54_18360 [Kitasatospora sp. NPDC094028]